jgi:trigger factor
MVKVTAEQLPESQMRVSVEVEPERVAKSVDKAFRKLVNQMNIPGFRRGKAPRNVVERMVGKETLLQEGLDILLNEVYREALTELDINPVDQPRVDLEPDASALKLGDAVTVKFTVPVLPEITLGDYKAVRLPIVAVNVTPEQADESIERIRDRQAEWTAVERPVQLGDRVTMDLHAQVGTYTQLYSAEGEPLVQSGEANVIADQKEIEREIAKPSPLLLDSVVDQIVGMTPGQEKTFEVSLPQDSADEELAGKMATYHVKVHSVREKHVPALDDEFAKSVGFESVDRMREEVLKRAQEQAQSESRRAYENLVIDRVVNESQAELPAAMVNHEIEHQIEEVGETLKRQNIALDEYLKLTKKTHDELHEEYRESATRSVKTSLVLSEVAEKEGIEVSPDEIDREIEATAAVFGEQGDRIRQQLSRPEQRERLENRLRTRKVIDLLTGYAETPVEAANAEAPATVEPTTETPSAEAPTEE